MSENNNLFQQLADAISNTHAKAPAAFLDDKAPFAGEQRSWLNGLLTGLHAIASAASGDKAVEAVGTPLVILYGSQSGKAESLSKDLKKYAKTQGFDARISELDAVEPASLANLQHLLIVCSTFGEGEPPDNAKTFYKTLMTADISLPASLNFSVCGLGDSSYAQFNRCARDIDARLAALGASRVHELVACDLAYEDEYADWKTSTFATEAFVKAAGAKSVATVSDDKAPRYDKNNPFIANLIATEPLSGEASAKQVNHIEISLAGSAADLNYQVGDALGVWPLNNPQSVADVLAAARLSGRETVQLKDGPASLKAALLSRLDIVTVNAKAFEAWGFELPELQSPQLIDVLLHTDKAWPAQLLVDGLRPLQPRLYSIASSPKAHPGEVHLTVGEVHYSLHGRDREGVASTFLGQRLAEGASLGVYLQASAHFHLPENDDMPLIMIGPGTGIAPFRAFLEEREARGAKGKNWLFFGDQREACDFLYRDQIKAWHDSGLLTELSLAWSRDGAEKVYVQTLMRQRASDVFGWLEQGAAIYICGDASRMAADVDRAIRQIVAEQGGLDAPAVDAYMAKLVAEHRYQRDVY
jgi:sulfite reductase (NADPH) flavoprotein alpha-component